MPKPRTSIAKPTEREIFVSNVLLWHLMDSIRAMHFGDPETTWDGTTNEGRFSSTNGEGDHHVAAWNPRGLVAMAFDHESPASEASIPRERRNPERLFEDAPEVLAPLVKALVDWRASDRLGTAARWFARVDDAEVEGSAEETDQLVAYESPTKKVLTGWRKAAGISKEQAELAASWALDETRARRTVSTEEALTLLQQPASKEGHVLDPKFVAKAVDALAQAGVDWPDGVETAQRLNAADPDQGLALIDAIVANDVEGVKALLAKGANVERRARPGQLEGRHAPGGESALNLALEQDSPELVNLLLDAGANPDARGHLNHPLSRAAELGRRDLCDLLLARGASHAAHQSSLFYAALTGGSADVVELALDLGAKASMSVHWFDMLLAIVEKSGRSDLLARCPDVDKLRAANAASQTKTLADAHASAGHTALTMGMLHLVHATRGVHFETQVTSHFEGRLQSGRYAVSHEAGRHAVVAWSEVGVVGWAVRLGRRNPVEPQTPPKLFEKAPASLIALAMDLSSWKHAPPAGEEARWTDARAERAAAAAGQFGQGQASEIWGSGDSYETPAGRRFTAPRESAELHTRTLIMLRQLLVSSLEDNQPSLSAEDEKLLLEPQPGGTKEPRRAGITEAIRCFAELGIVWKPSRA